LLGWNLYEPHREFRRLNIPNEHLRLSYVNSQYQMCPTYPAVLCVPASITDTQLISIASFRSRGRIPVCVWQNPLTLATLWRCSQPRVGVNSNRNMDDEILLEAASNITPNNNELIIFDCRPRSNARANWIAGKGYESTDFYRRCKLFFMNVGNIHVMRDSYQKLVRTVYNENQHSVNYKSALQSSGWLFHISDLLKAANAIVQAIDRDQTSVLNRCRYDKCAKFHQCSAKRLHIRNLQSLLIIFSLVLCHSFAAFFQ